MSSFSGSLHFMYMETTPSLKRTISQRSNSDSSESSSLWEKRPKSLAEEDEVLQALNIAGNVSEKLDKILGELKKLEKLDAIETTLKDLTSRLGNVESTIDKMKETARAVDSSITGMDESLTHLIKEVEELRGTVNDKDKQIEYLHMQHLYLESYCRRENLKNFLAYRKAKPALRRGKMRLAQLMFCVIFFMMSLALWIQRGIWSFNECIGLVNPYVGSPGRYKPVSYAIKIARQCFVLGLN